MDTSALAQDVWAPWRNLGPALASWSPWAFRWNVHGGHGNRPWGLVECRGLP